MTNECHFSESQLSISTCQMKKAVQRNFSDWSHLILTDYFRPGGSKTNNGRPSPDWTGPYHLVVLPSN